MRTNNEINNWRNIPNIRNLQKAMTEFLTTQNFQMHITANFNRATTINNGRSKLSEWAKFVDRKFHGRCFYKKPIEKRMFFAAIPEVGGFSGNLHYHMLVKLPGVYENFSEYASDVWRKLNRTGDMCIQKIDLTKGDPIRLVRYDMKEVRKSSGYENIVFSNELNYGQDPSIRNKLVEMTQEDNQEF